MATERNEAPRVFGLEMKRHGLRSWKLSLYGIDVDVSQIVHQHDRFCVVIGCRIVGDFSAREVTENVERELIRIANSITSARDAARAAELAAKPAVLVGSTWQFRGLPGGNPTPGPRVVDHVDSRTVHTLTGDGGGTDWPLAMFHELHDWISDPEGRTNGDV